MANWFYFRSTNFNDVFNIHLLSIFLLPFRSIYTINDSISFDAYHKLLIMPKKHVPKLVTLFRDNLQYCKYSYFVANKQNNLML